MWIIKDKITTNHTRNTIYCLTIYMFYLTGLRRSGPRRQVWRETQRQATISEEKRRSCETRTSSWSQRSRYKGCPTRQGQGIQERGTLEAIKGRWRCHCQKEIKGWIRDHVWTTMMMKYKENIKKWWLVIYLQIWKSIL